MEDLEDSNNSLKQQLHNFNIEQATCMKIIQELNESDIENHIQ